MANEKLTTNLPPIPASQDASTTRWMQAASQLMRQIIQNGGGGLSVQDLIDSGMAKSDGKGGFYPVTPRPNLTVPPKMTGLTANGAFALVIMTWDEAPVSYSNYSHVEVWRSSVNDIGQASLIGTTVSLIYTDAIGTGADNYYWVRSVSTSDVRGDFSTSARGQTSLDVKYVMQMLTAIKWTPNTVYSPFQYVQPTIANGFTYLAVNGGTSGATEPVWNRVLGGSTTDNDITWKTRAVGQDVPFAIGSVNGKDSVVINQLYVEDASITNAKIGNLSADKIATGFLAADRIAASSITAEKLNVVSLSAVSATIGRFRSAPSGARTEISDSLIQIYDSTGQLRVRMGVW